MNNTKWYDNLQIEPMIWFGFFCLLVLAVFVPDLNDTASKLLFMGSGFCASRIRTPKTNG